MWSLVDQHIRARLTAGHKAAEIERQVRAGRLSPVSAADRIIGALGMTGGS
jgi:hypothetical protein